MTNIRSETIDYILGSRSFSLTLAELMDLGLPEDYMNLTPKASEVKATKNE